MSAGWRRRLAYGSNATVVTVVVLGVVVMLQILADRHSQRWDLSEGGSNTLQAETLDKLRLADETGEAIAITGFSAQQGKSDAWFKDQAMADLLLALTENSQVVEARLVNFDRERLTAERLGVTEYGHMVLQRGSDRVDIKARELFRRTGRGAERRMEFVGEAAVARAFAQLDTPRRRAIYVLTGHGEMSLQDPGPGGLSSFAAILDGERYDTEALDLLRTDRDGSLPDVPEDAAMVCLARPTQALTSAEADTLLDWVGRGGSLLIATDVGQPVPSMLARLGLGVPEGVGLQLELQVPFRDRPIPTYRSHPITRDLSAEKIHTVLAHPATLRIAEPEPPGIRYARLLSSTRSGWLDRGGELVGGAARYEPGVDIEGPVDFAVAVTALPGQGLVRASKPAARIVVSADADLFSNALLDEAPGNATLAENMVHWLVGEDRRLGAAGAVGKATRVRRLALTAQELGKVRWLAMGLMPFLVLLLGIGVWQTRRGR